MTEEFRYKPVARSSSDDNAIRYVLPVLSWPIIGQGKATPVGRILKVDDQGQQRGQRLISTIALLYIHLYSPQTVAQEEKKNKESNSLTKSCTTSNDSDEKTYTIVPSQKFFIKS